LHGDAAHEVVAQMLGHLHRNVDVELVVVDGDGVENIGQCVGWKLEIDGGADDLFDAAYGAGGHEGVSS
jgi:hypothetical protein